MIAQSNMNTNVTINSLTMNAFYADIKLMVIIELLIFRDLIKRLLQ